MSAVQPIVHVAPVPPASQAELRARVIEKEELIRRMASIDLHVEHYFAHGVYGRALYIPKGVVLTGKIHKFAQINVLLMGDISVLTEEGVKRVRPPFVIVSPAGTKRIAVAHEDTIWLTLHGTHETDVDKIEAEFIAQSEEEYAAFCNKQLEIEGGQPCLG